MSISIRAALAAAILFLTACAQVSRVGPGEVIIGTRLAVAADSAWNQFPAQPGGGPQTVWTIDGTPIDALQFFVGLRDGTALAPAQKDKQAVEFKSTMQKHELPVLFQNLFARDGSVVSVDRTEPAAFLGGEGLRVDFSLTRRVDDVKLRGVVWILVQKGELFAITFTAPRLNFFQRHVARVEQLVAQARLKS